MRHLLTCGNSARVAIIRRACRMLFQGLVDGYLNLILGSRWGARPLDFLDCEATTHFRALVHPLKRHRVVLSKGKKKRSKGPYTSEDAKFTRERCIRVAAIVIMITPGASNVCSVEKKREIKNLPLPNPTRRTRCSGSNNWNRIEPNDQLSEVYGLYGLRDRYHSNATMRAPTI